MKSRNVIRDKKKEFFLIVIRGLLKEEKYVLDLFF